MIAISEIDISCFELWNVDYIGAIKSEHPHDYVGNWLWDDGGCMLWDDGGVIKL